MVEIGDIGIRILKEYNVNLYTFCPRDFPVYQRVLEEADKIRSKLAKELRENIPDCFREKN